MYLLFVSDITISFGVNVIIFVLIYESLLKLLMCFMFIYTPFKLLSGLSVFSSKFVYSFVGNKNPPIEL